MAQVDPSGIAKSLRARLPEELQSPLIAIVCGSGLAGLAELLSDRIDIPYTEIDGFQVSTVAGHASKLSFGRLAGISVVAAAGRYHTYEGKPLSLVTLPVKVFHSLGCKAAIITNAAGGLNPSFSIPTICVVRDHIALPVLAGLNPLVGPNDDTKGPRFLPLSNAYDIALQRVAYRAGQELKFSEDLMQPATYAYVMGPTYETRADCKFLREHCGADIVGMSTVPEVIMAHYLGLKVLCLSLVTNKVVNNAYRDIKAEVATEYTSGAGLRKAPETAEEKETVVNHEEVLEMGKVAAKDMSALVERVVEMAAKIL